MSALYLQLHTFCGQPLEDGFREATRVATMLGLWVEVEINGIRTLVAPGDLPETLEKNWRKAHERGADFVSANIIPNPIKRRI